MLSTMDIFFPATTLSDVNINISQDQAKEFSAIQATLVFPPDPALL